MKQSTKLLSLVLALIMAFSCMSVIGSAALVKSEVVYDGIDDADLTYAQVANLAMDLIDNLVIEADLGVINLYVAKLDLSSVDKIFYSLVDVSGGIAWAVAKGLLGDVGQLSFSALKDGDGKAYQRGPGEADYNMICALLGLLGDSGNADRISKVAYGIGTSNGISLGLIGSFLDLGEVGDMLSDIPGLLTGLLFDLLVYGSYGYNMDIDDIKDAKSTLTATYPEMDTIDEMLPNALYNLLTKPQDYEWVGEGDDAVKVWDMNSVVMPGLTLTAQDINPLRVSFFELLDKAAQIAIDEIGVPALNNNLKKALMVAVEADLNEIDVTALPADVYAAFEVDKKEEEKSYVTYFAYDKLAKSGGTWYYTTRETEVVLENGEPKIDEEGNEVTERVRKFFKVNMGASNEFSNLINWDWEFVGSDVTPTGNQKALIYNDFITANGSLVGSINNLVGIVYDVALTDAAKADFVNKVKNDLGVANFNGWIKGGNVNLNANILYLAKYILTEFGDKVFGEDSPYAKYTMADLKKKDLIGIVAMIGPKFFEDAMPQIILPQNADGSYAFHTGTELWEFAAIVLRELMTGIAPIVNYDAYIFENGNVTSANDRLFKKQSVDNWFNIILNMGTDLGLVYLQQLTNFGDFVKAESKFASLADIDAWVKDGKGGVDATHWQTSLNAVIFWALDYVGGERSTGVLAGINYNKLSEDAYAHPFDKLSYILNTILPLGFIGDGTYTSDAYDFDIKLFVDGVKTLLSTFDLTAVLSLLGRNTASDYNLLGDSTLATGVLELVNQILGLVFGTTILQNVQGRKFVVDNNKNRVPQSLDAVVSRAALKTTVKNILVNLNARKHDILKNIAPVLGKLISGWGTEQRFKKPSAEMSHYQYIEGGNSWYEIEWEEKEGCKEVTKYGLESTFNVKFTNNSDGVWRHYIDAQGQEQKDEHYLVELVSVNAYDYQGNASPYIKEAKFKTGVKLSAGEALRVDIGVGEKTHSKDSSQTGGIGAKNIPEQGVLARVSFGYKVYDESGNAMLDGQIFKDDTYVWLSQLRGNEGDVIQKSSDKYNSKYWSPIYVPFERGVDLATTVEELTVGAFWRTTSTFGGKEDHSLKLAGGDRIVDGVTLSDVSVKSENKEYSEVNLKLFKSETVNWKLSDGTDSGTTITTTGSVNKDEFEAKATIDKIRSAAGYSQSWSVNATTADGTESGTLVLKYYDAEYRDLLRDLVNQEMGLMRDKDDYKYSGTVTTRKELRAVDGKDLEGKDLLDDFKEPILRETNFSKVSNGGTVIDCKTAWDNYSTALNNALTMGLQDWNSSSKFNFKEVYDAFRVAVNDVDHCRKTAADNVQTLDTDILALEQQLRNAQAETTDVYNYTDYKMYRINRYNDARDDANGLITLMKNANLDVADFQGYFDYNWMESYALDELVSAHTVKFGDSAGTNVPKNEYYDYIMALVEPYSAEELEEKVNWLDNVKKEYISLPKIDVAIASTKLQLTQERLLKRDCGVIYTQLNDEIASAKNMIGITNNGRYTEGSWANYIAAYNDAVAAQTCGSQKQVFDAKYKLCVERKDLVKVADKAEYEELNALISHANFVLDNPGLYESKVEGMPINKVLGMVLAERGMDKITSVDGYDVNLFPGSALETVANAYGKEDQNKIDDAAWVLKEALSRLTFKDLAVKETDSGTFVEREIIVNDDKLTEDVNEEVTALVSHIAAKQGESNIKDYFTVQATKFDASKLEVVVSNDVNYAVSYTGQEEFKGFAGTNSTVTFYTTYNGVKLPVATVKIVVDGDINGDGVIDALDAAYAALVSVEKDKLEGCFFLAGDVNNDGKVNADDFGKIVNTAVGKKAS